jgi:RNA polymerase sigma factor (sigma-70 family)
MTEPDTDPVERFVSTIHTGREPSKDEADALAELLRVWLARRGLDPQDREEVCNDAVLRLLVAAQRDRLDPARPPGAWLRVVADHLAIDALRRRGRQPGIAFDEERHTVAAHDDRLAALLSRSAAASDIRHALRAAADTGEHDVVATISTWLGLADANGDAPSSREVGQRLGVSHMTVQRALKAFGQRLQVPDVPGQA